MENFKKQINEKLLIHNKLSRLYKIKHTIYGLPPILIPLLSGCLINILPNENHVRIISSTGFLLTGVCVSIYRFLNLGSLTERHQIFSSYYQNILNEINSNPDIDIAHVELKLHYLNMFSPDENSVCIEFC